jgi:hypothetical protein
VAQIPEHEAVERPDSAGGTDRDAVATVTEHARRLASERGRSPIRTTDLLRAVTDVYGADLDRLLIGHGTSRDELLEALARDLPDARER